METIKKNEKYRNTKTRTIRNEERDDDDDKHKDVDAH